MEMLFVAVIILFVLIYNKTIDSKKFIQDNKHYFNVLREDDYDFLVRAKYGEDAKPDVLFDKRIQYGVIVAFIFLFIFLDSISLLNVALAIGIAFLVFKLPYTQLKKYYKAHLHEIDLMLPYYLKSLEILVQHYTVPVALARSIDTAPDIFKEGLRKLVDKVNQGDSSVDPYMDFAKEYPVRDSMRMMRLLYRLSLGSQENKEEQLMMFSRTISQLQNKAREQKYKDRLEKMEKKTMMMLCCTGGGIIFLLLLSMTQMMGL